MESLARPTTRLAGLFAFALALGQCGVASAQTGGSLAPLRPAMAVSQAGPPSGITVVGRSTVSVAPDRIRVTVRLTPRGVNDAQLESLADSVATSMRTGGVTDAKVVLPLAGYLGPQSALAVIGTISKPTRATLETIVRATLKAIPDATALALANAYQVQAAYAVDDCSGPEARAQVAAIADARARAERIANAAGLHLGPIVSVNESTTFPQPGCGPDSDTFAPAVSNEDPYGALEVRLAINAIVTFSLRP